MTRGCETIAIAARRVSADYAREGGNEVARGRVLQDFDGTMASGVMIPQYPPMIGYSQLSWLALPSLPRSGFSPCTLLASVARSTPPRRLVSFLPLLFLTCEKRLEEGGEKNCGSLHKNTATVRSSQLLKSILFSYEMLVSITSDSSAVA